MDLFLSDAISLDTELVSDYPQIVKLGDRLFDEVSGQIKILNKYRSKEALKLILINLYKGYLWNRAVRYSRDKAFYAAGSRYNQIWFRYDRVIPIIDALKALGYADFKDGMHFPDEDVLYQSRIWASPKLRDLFHEFEFQTITRLRERPPKEIIQLRASKKNGGRRLMKYEDDHKTETMRANLNRYNRFIEGHDVEVRLPPDAEVSWQFLESRRGNILKERVEITAFDTDNAFVLMVGSKKYNGYQIEGMKFIFDHEGISDDERNGVSEWQVSLSSLDTYFLHYMDYSLSKFSPKLTTPSTQQPQETPSITQSISEVSSEDQSLTLPKSTTIRDLEEYSLRRPLSFYGIRRLHFRSKWQHLHRVFTQYLDQGGRFYGAVHLDLPSKFRAHIFIDGHPSVELDYGAHHVRMLYNWLDIPYDKDPYAELCRAPEERPIYKKVLLVGINARNKWEALYAIRNELKAEGFSGKFLTDEYLKECLDRFKEFHKPIAGFLHKGQGLFLQYDDSRIMDEILMSMVSKKIPALPVHDSVIVPAEHEGTLRQVMTEAYQKIMGKDFMPMIK